MTDLNRALNAALAGEHAAIYAYGVLGSHLSAATLALAQQTELAHRNLRDSLLEALPSPVAAEAIYALPFAVTGKAAAIALAVYVEEHCAVLWRDVVVSADATTRTSQLATFTATALRAAAFRRAGGATPGTVAFPGLTA
jgi:hypothetical protein